MLSKRTLITFLFLLIGILTPKAEVAKHALLIGVGNYEVSSGWENLNSINDVELMTKALLHQGFKQENIHQLLDEEFSKRSLFQIMEKQLLTKINKGDLIVFHYSGHGQQIQDLDGDELDGLDEAMVPYNSPKNHKAGVYEGEHLIRDDELNTLFFKLRKKLGPKGHLLVLMDACHSGTATRGLAKARGTDIVMAPKDYLNTLDAKSTSTQLLDFDQDLEQAASMICLFSSSARQLSYEYQQKDGKSYGLFSYAFCKYLNELNGASSYEGLWRKIKHFIGCHTSLQEPQLEGAGELVVMGGHFLPKTVYYPVGEWINENTILLNSGTVQGLYKGTKVALYPVDTRDTLHKEKIAVGEIVYTESFMAEIELDRAVESRQVLPAWVYVVAQNYGALSVTIKLDMPEDQLLKHLGELISQNSSIERVDQNADLVLQRKRGTFQLINKDDYLLLEEADPAANQIISYCLATAQSQYLRTLDVSDEQYKGRIRLLKDGRQEERFSLGEEFEIEIKNEGTTDFYFNLLDIQPDNILNLLPLSEDDRSIEEYFLKPGETFVSQTMEIVEPSGTEVFKLIVTPSPVDLSNIMINNPQNFRGENQCPLGILLSGNFLNENKRGVNRIQSGIAGIYSKIFYIID